MTSLKNGKASEPTFDPQNQVGMAFHLQKRFAEFQFDAMSEILGFLGQRLQAQAEFWRGLSNCTDLSQASEAQRRFWEQASEDYTKEARYLSDAAKRSMDTMTQPVPQDRAA